MIVYKHISDAVEFYRNNGFIEIEVPWAIDSSIIEITRPTNGINVKSDYGCLVASAEQSFLSLRVKSGICGRFQATTPCFRNELEDELHKKYFIKTELFVNDVVSFDVLFDIINKSVSFFSKYLDVEVIKVSADQYDIIDKTNKIELGSYGIREHAMIGRWIYATGCAEPRLSFAISKQASNV